MQKDYTWILFGDSVKSRYQEYGLLPLIRSESGPDKAEFKSFNSLTEKEAYLRELTQAYPAFGSYIVVDNIRQKLYIWWKSQSDDIRRVFSVILSYEKSWQQLDFTTRAAIYSYCIIKENGIPIPEDAERSLLSGILCDLSDIILTLLNNKELEEMCDDNGSFLEEYQNQFNRIYDEIEDSILNIPF